MHSIPWQAAFGFNKDFEFTYFITIFFRLLGEGKLLNKFRISI